MAAAIGDCLFCRLSAGEGEASIVNEDRRTVTLMDIQPLTVGHMLVIPRVHATYLDGLEPEDGAQMFRVAQAAASSLRGSTLRCEGVNFFLSDGEAAGQDVFHVHLHVFPRYAGDGFGLRTPPDYAVRPRLELDSAASRSSRRVANRRVTFPNSMSFSSGVVRLWAETREGGG